MVGAERECNHLERLAVVPFDKLGDEVRGGMAMEIGREITDADTVVVGITADRPQHIDRGHVAQDPSFGRFALQVRTIDERQQRPRRRAGLAAVETITQSWKVALEPGPVANLDLIEKAKARDERIVGVDAHHHLERRDGRARHLQFGENAAEIVVRRWDYPAAV